MLRSGNSFSEIEAYIWFTGNFIHNVSGASSWGQRKYHDSVSRAKDPEMGECMVTVSDEACTLLLYENYIGKWLVRYKEDRTQSTDKDNKRMNGRYTQSTRGSNKYGGWTEEGVRQFNQLCACLVQESRRHPLTSQKEKMVMNKVKKKMPIARMVNQMNAVIDEALHA
jgi:hypothetical protein